VFLRVAAGLGVAAVGIGLLVDVSAAAGFLYAPIHFPYRGFEWVHPLPIPQLRILVAALSVVGVLVAVGWKYRVTCAIAALGAAYLFFLDSAYYQSTAWFTVLVLSLLIFLPANHLLAFDARRIQQPGRGATRALFLARFQVGVLYVFSGIAKLDADFLSGRTLRAMTPNYPPARWFPADASYAVLSCLGMLFDLLIVPLLLWKRPRVFGWIALIAFHIHNALTLSVGVVPWTMLVASTVFLPPDWPRKLLRRLPESPRAMVAPSPQWLRAIIGLWIAFQIALPASRWLYRGNPYFTEMGFHFSWALRSRSKNSFAEYRIVDLVSGRTSQYLFGNGLPRAQAERASGDPFALWWRAQQLAPKRRRVAIYVDTRIQLNGAREAPLIQPTVDLLQEHFPLIGVPAWVRPHP
jgi:vitamin K-dependent gamma-carboxylase